MASLCLMLSIIVVSVSPDQVRDGGRVTAAQSDSGTAFSDREFFKQRISFAQKETKQIHILETSREYIKR